MSGHRESRAGDGTMRTSMRISRFDDDEEDFSLSAMGISDGFSPSNAASSSNRMSSHRLRRESTGRRTPPPRPSSITKPRVIDSFALRHDGSTQSSGFPLSSTPSNNRISQTRPSTVLTNAPPIATETPYQGPSEPSHPYHMYPQGTRPVRTGSVATVSTFQPAERTYTGPLGPAHPYGMYPQDASLAAENSEPDSAIPVGFPGRRDDYQRRLGPDGEEAGDIIGPLGHTEQLPPYTQYPMESIGKAVRGIPIIPSGAGGIGLATRNPEFESREDLVSSDSHEGTSSLNSETSYPQLNTAALGESEKVPEKRWKQIAQKKACGIVPVWAFVLVGGAFVLFVIILGTILATGPKHGRHHSPYGYQSAQGDQNGTVYSTATTLDASALTAVPTGIPILPTGTFSLPIFAPYSTQQTCLENSGLYSAWSCAMPMSILELTITRSNNSSNSLNNNKISITHNNNSLSTWFYGSQPPSVVAQQTMCLVKDLDQIQLGPAWFFQIPYNKVVVVHENAFSAKKRRGQHNEFYGDFLRKGIAQPGEKPWFCYWNGTLLEAFIYVNSSSTGASVGAIPSSSSSTGVGRRGQGSPATVTVQASSSEATGYYDPDIPPSYSKIIKVEERRIPDSPIPYCNQMVIQSDGSAIPNLDASGNPVILKLNETEPESQSSSKRNLAGHIEMDKRQSSQGCVCEWLTS